MRAKSVSNLRHFPVNYLAVVSATVHLEAIARQGGDAARDFLNAPHRYLTQILQKGPGPEQRGQVKG